MSDHLKKQHSKETIEERSDLINVNLVSKPSSQLHIPLKKSGNSHVFDGLLPKAAQEIVSNQSANSAVIPAVQPIISKDHNSQTKRFHAEKHGASHVFEGLLPDAASEISPVQKGITISESNLHNKHTDSEIMNLRRRDMSQIRPTVQQILSQELGRISLIFTYLVAAMFIALTIITKDKPFPNNIAAPVIGSLLLLIISFLIYVKKSRARHHAAIFTAIAIIILGIVILDYIKYGS
jgi:hypothetical protein